MTLIPVATWANNWDQWLLYHRAAFDGPNKLIYIDPTADVIDVQVDLYSDWKEWTIISEQAGRALKWDAAFRTTGGDPTPSGPLGRTFFLINGWKIVVSHGIRFVGNLLTDDGSSPFVTSDGVALATSEVSTLVVERTDTEATQVLVDAVWDHPTSEIVTPGSIGELVLNLNRAQVMLNTTVATVTDAQTFVVTGAVGYPDGYFEEHFLQIISGTDFAVGLIDGFTTDGTVILTKPLPFTPTTLSQALLMAQRYVGVERVR